MENNFISIFLLNYIARETTLSRVWEEVHVYSPATKVNKNRKKNSWDEFKSSGFVCTHTEEIKIGCFKMRIFSILFLSLTSIRKWMSVETYWNSFFLSHSHPFLRFIIIDDSFSFPLVYMSILCCAPVAFGT